MSKISPLFSHYLQENKEISLEGIGKFFLKEDASYVDPSEKNAPPIPVTFEYDVNAITDEGFVNYIIKETGKIRPLALADLDTFLNLGKQLLNISKPLVIEGVGTLNKATAGNLEFIAGVFEHPKINTDNDRDKRLRQAKDVNREKAISFESNYVDENKKSKGLLKKVLGALTLLVILGGLGFAGYKLLMTKKETTKENTATKKEIAAPTDTTKNKLNTTIAKNPTLPDSLGRVEYKMVIDVLNKLDAEKRYNKLISFGYKPLLYSSDSINYKVAIPVRILPQDTTRAKDSIQRNFILPTQIKLGKKVIIE